MKNEVERQFEMALSNNYSSNMLEEISFKLRRDYKKEIVENSEAQGVWLQIDFDECLGYRSDRFFIKKTFFNKLVSKKTGFKIIAKDKTIFSTKERDVKILAQAPEQLIYFIIGSKFHEKEDESSFELDEEEYENTKKEFEEKFYIESIFFHESFEEKANDYAEDAFKNKLSNQKEVTESKPSIYMLSVCQYEGFQKQEYKVDWAGIEVKEEFYPSGFSDFLLKTNDFLKSKESLMLLHGDPRTGKTSFIKYFVTQNPQTKFFWVPKEIISQLSSPSFIRFLKTLKNCCFIIEDAEDQLAERETVYDSSAVSNILNLTDGILSDIFEIKIIATFNCDIERIDKALIGKGRLFAEYNFKKLSIKEAKKASESIGNPAEETDAITSEMSLGEVFAINSENRFSEKNERSIGFGQ